MDQPAQVVVLVVFVSEAISGRRISGETVRDRKVPLGGLHAPALVDFGLLLFCYEQQSVVFQGACSRMLCILGEQSPCHSLKTSC